MQGGFGFLEEGSQRRALGISLVNQLTRVVVLEAQAALAETYMLCQHQIPC